MVELSFEQHLVLLLSIHKDLNLLNHYNFFIHELNRKVFFLFTH